ncbi:hypothetical protein BpHYR1_018377 [Brachionus plicatilis]|uniref:Uncharacterized protein n=1 Tax=Brachionus plicatilis TaxID=10195 RepID=A0A3M7PM78_BRAPC|nr:hypothetical protein BpHYR1_018377 [Brachionus plicatilis]
MLELIMPRIWSKEPLPTIKQSENNDEHKRVIQDVETRWIKHRYKLLDDDQISILIDHCLILAPFYKVTVRLSSQILVSSSLIIPSIIYIKTKLNQPKFKNPRFIDLSNALKRCFDNYITKLKIDSTRIGKS